MIDHDKQIRVHIVDDDPADFLIIDELLLQSSRFRFEVNHISSIGEARQELIDPQCDVFLLDYFLGRETARDLLIEARKVHCPAPIVVLTGVESGTLDDEVIQLGAADFLPKGDMTVSLLERTIRHAIQHKRAELELEQMVKRDPLTGLGNRLLFEEILEGSLARCKRAGTRLAVLFMDLDRFKEINDSLGHPTGDLLLLLIADRLRSVMREADFVARIGGDEFTILIEDLHNAEDALNVARKIIQTVSQPSAIGGHELNVSASIGMALFPENGDAPIKLMQKADIALYEAKRKGLNKVQCFTSNLQTQLEKHLNIEKGLRHALEHDHFELMLQPQWDLRDRRIVGFEALIRWRFGSELVPPSDFIPVAEKTGLIVPIGEWLLQTACRYLGKWRELGVSDYRISVNVSPLQLKAGYFVETLQSALKSAGIAASQLEVEITEDSLLDGHEENPKVQQDLSRIRELGVKIAIDDFGTGYSSLRYLRQFPADVVKIDKSFVSGNGGQSLAEPEICRAVVTMADSLGMDVVAEGIETISQLTRLRAMGCRMGQGYLVSKPLAFDEATQWALAGEAVSR